MLRLRAPLLSLLTFSLLTACASYQPVPLEQSAGLAKSIKQLQLQAVTGQPYLPPAWQPRAVRVDDGLNETEVALLALLNNPHLRAVQAQVGEARAQVKQAGLLPDPQIGTSLDFSTNGGPKETTGENFTAGIDLQQIITRSARRDAAIETARATWLNMLWQQWQTVQQARILYRRSLIQHRQQAVAQQQFKQAETTWKVEHEALAQGNATLEEEGLALAPMMDAQAALDESKRQLNTTLHDLHLLIGLDPSAALVLDERGSPAQLTGEKLITPPLSDAVLQTALDMIGERRPDLLALQAGYNSQEARVRTQILSRFPAISIGVNNLRDTAGLWTLGPFINLGLPIFNANRGKIAEARATRQRLHDEFHDRLTSAYVETRKMAKDQQLVFAEWQALHRHLPQLAETAKRMSQALGAGEIDMLTFTTLRTTYFSQQARVLMLEQVLLEQQVALETLTGGLLPAPNRTNPEQP